VQNLVGIDSAVTDLRMRKKHDFVCIVLLTYLSIYLSARFFVGATGHSFMAILTLNGSNDVIPQPLVPFGGHINNDRLSACCGDWQFGRWLTGWRILNQRI